LQIEGITSLSRAVERAKALKIIQGDNYAREREKTNKSFPKEGQNNNFNGKKGTEGNGKQAEEGKNEQRGNSRGSRNASRGECWTCGKTGHFRSECPQERGNTV
jgi:hypothetical protein